MERGFLSQKGSGRRSVKEKSLNASNIEVVMDGVVPPVTVEYGNTAKEVVSLVVVDETVETTMDGNTPGKSLYANVTGKPSRTKVNFRTLFTPRGNRIDVVVPLESIRAISKRFANTAYGFFLGKRVAYPVVANYGKSSYAKAMIELRADVELKDNIVVDMPKLVGRATILVIFVLSISGNLPGNVDYGSPSTTPIIEKIDKIKKLIINGRVTLVDDKGKPLEYSGDYDSEDEVASVDNEMASFLAKKDGYGTQSLLEQ
nr:hypothetical protein [Tanacetum cinerariifolium]